MAFLPSKDRAYLSNAERAFREVVAGGVNGLVLPDFPLPPGKFDHAASSLLIVLPPGYPDVPPDMFYMNPWIRLAATKAYARCTDQPHNFDQISWQRWSRHNSEWRRGVDGIWTMFKRVQHALEEAK